MSWNSDPTDAQDREPFHPKLVLYTTKTDVYNSSSPMALSWKTEQNDLWSVQVVEYCSHHEFTLRSSA